MLIIALERTPNPTGDSGIENVDDAPGVKVGEEPVAIGVNPATNTIYVCNYKSNTVSVINGSNDKVVSVIPTVDKNPSQILVNSRTNMIYVYTQSDNGLTIINGSTNKVVGNLT